MGTGNILSVRLCTSVKVEEMGAAENLSESDEYEIGEERGSRDTYMLNLGCGALPSRPVRPGRGFQGSNMIRPFGKNNVVSGWSMDEKGKITEIIAKR